VGYRSGLILHLLRWDAIVPAHLPTSEEFQRPPGRVPVLGPWARTALVGIAVGLSAVFGIAIWLDPYEENGSPRRMGTHLQAGLPPCTFQVVTGLPCPSCGMTTSFALLVRGDVLNSLRANAVGTLLALFWLALIPWSLASAIARRYFWIITAERALLVAVMVFVGLLLIRWAFVLGLGWWSGKW
jgi:hypothetical protein